LKKGTHLILPFAFGDFELNGDCEIIFLILKNNNCTIGLKVLILEIAFTEKTNESPAL
jgi:hypothetical protein